MGLRKNVVLELKAVDASQRLIEGYAAVTGNIDAGDDVIESGAFKDTLDGRKFSEIPVPSEAHNLRSMPIGIPVEVREDGRGLYTKTRIHRTQAGDDLLAVASERLAEGMPLGMSIGYKADPASVRWERKDGRTVRRIGKLYLGEYSFTAIPMNPEAAVTAVKDTWTAQYVNDLPDSSFAYVEAGGDKDEDGKTTPRSLRHFPIKDADGKPDEAHVRNALSRLPQSEFESEARPAIEKAAAALGIEVSGGKVRAKRWSLKQMSLEERQGEIREAIRNRTLGPLAPPMDCPWIVATYEDRVIVQDDNGDYWQIPYTLEGEEATLGEAIEVEQTWTPVAKSGAAQLEGKDGRVLSGTNAEHLQQIHDRAHAMAEGAGISLHEASTDGSPSKSAHWHEMATQAGILELETTLARARSH